MTHVRSFGIAGGIAASFGHAALAGPDWVEGRDAGSLLSSSQRIVGLGNLNTIEGSLSSALSDPDFEDMYLFRISDPDTFSLTISATNFNTAVWLFNVSKAEEAFGLLANDDDGKSFSSYLESNSNDGSLARVTTAGVYAIAISGSGRIPVSRSGAIFTFATSSEISGPDGPGGINPHEGWAGEGITGDYLIRVTGVEFYDVPAPGTIGMLAGLGLANLRRRR